MINRKENLMKKLVYFITLFSILLAACAGQSADGAAQEIAITHVNLVPMTEEIVLADQTVLIAGSWITAVGPSDEIDIPEDALIIDGTGAYLMPGLADMHMHTTPAWETDWPVFPFILYLANGVTTVRNMDPLPDATMFWSGAMRSNPANSLVRRCTPPVCPCKGRTNGDHRCLRQVMRRQSSRRMPIRDTIS